MPLISSFFGIIIKIFHKDHNPPHFHAIYGEYDAVIEIKSGKVLAGKIPPRALRLVNEWRKIHKDELIERWDNARNMKPLKRIKPLE